MCVSVAAVIESPQLELRHVNGFVSEFFPESGNIGVQSTRNDILGRMVGGTQGGSDGRSQEEEGGTLGYKKG